MAHHETGPRTFVEMVLLLLEDRFPWLGSDQPVSGSDTVDQLSALHQMLLTRRSKTQRQQRTLIQYHSPPNL